MDLDWYQSALRLLGVMALGPSAYRKKRLARFCLAKNPLETGMDLIRIMVAFEAAQAKVMRRLAPALRLTGCGNRLLEARFISRFPPF